MRLKSPEIKAQVDNIFNYSLDRNVSLDGVDPSVSSMWRMC